MLKTVGEQPSPDWVEGDTDINELVDYYIQPIEDQDERRRKSLKSLGITPSSTFMANPPPPMQWLVDGLVPDNSFIVLGGAPKTCKSWMALDIGISLALREPCFSRSDFTVQCQRSVLFIMLEDAATNIYGRVRAIGRSKGADVKALQEAPLYFRFSKELDLGDGTQVRTLANRISESIPNLGLVIIDPFRNAHGLDENDSNSVRQLTDNIRDLRDITGASILITHHLRKMSKQDKENPGFALRGSGAIYGAVDGLITLADEPKTASAEWLNHVKIRIKAGKEPDPFLLTLEVSDGPDNRADNVNWSVSGYCHDDK
jgi:RecA-family ATPase